MDETTQQFIAAQLRRPEGEHGVQVGEKMNEGNLQINQFAIAAMDLAVADKILEIGMGNGLFVKDILALDNSIHYTGCDFSELMVEEANKHNEAFVGSGQAVFICSDACSLPFQDDTFDRVLSVNTLYFWENPETVLAEIHRVLKPEGQVLLGIRPKSVMQHYPFTKYGFRMFDKDELTELLVSNHFKIRFVLEKEEGDHDINGVTVPVEALLVRAQTI